MARPEPVLPEDNGPPVLPKPRWSAAATILAVFLGFGVLVWPVASFVAIFIFDAPLQGPLDEARRYSFVLLTWGYPALYAAALAWYRALLKQPRPERTRLAVWTLPALTPLYYVWFFNFAG